MKGRLVEPWNELVLAQAFRLHQLHQKYPHALNGKTMYNIRGRYESLCGLQNISGNTHVI